ncbi:MAG TPA: hypothetical protein PLU39_15050 [Armatimonadota bacterium]|jgi:hypothetical protein|nr:hypothetical protein [Armatimonadota bacterium]HOJ23397.1 hypothetical protein [Armatimonadota bacterium]HOM83833.1 hypothetical protein [Armatimonadota bacterium]HOQ28789.1 hypothetical protein [Armatimonadota bacterium]HPO72969.1 hypothetical protein [Armatimonadota bacterium]
MSDSHFLRSVARWLSVLMLAGTLCPRLPAWAADKPASDSVVARMGAAVVDLSNNKVVLSAGERDGVVNGTIFRIMRHGEEIAQVKVFETSFATSNARVIRAGQGAALRVNDRAEVLEIPVPRKRSGFRFPWAALVGAGIVALVVMGAVRDKGDGPSTGSPTGGVAEINLN